MNAEHHCPKCQRTLPADGPRGLCPACLLAVGLGMHEKQNELHLSPAPTTPSGKHFPPPTTSDLAPQFPQLEIIEILGQGGMGTVYKARQKKLDRLVALKIVRSDAAADPAFAERFNREARTLARMSHPNIVAVHDFGEVQMDQNDTSNSQPLFFFVMEFVDGANLRQLMNGQRLESQQALAIVPQICEALQYAHDEGVVHRDIKPENILVDHRGRVKIADFGLAKLVAGSSDDFTLTGTHQVMGTPRYMAPEQMEGSHAVDHRADIYSLGVVFYEMLTGQQPFSAENSVALLRVVTDAPLVPPGQIRRHLARDMETIVLVAMAKHPSDRYRSAEAMASDLRRFRQGLRIVTRRPGGLRHWSRSAWHHRTLVAAGALMIFLATAAVLLVLRAQPFAPATTLAQDPMDSPETQQWVDALKDSPHRVLVWQPYAPLGNHTELASLGTVSGPVRLAVVATVTAEPVHLELLICDRDVGRGYRLRLLSGQETPPATSGAARTATVALLREDKIVASRSIPPLALGVTVNMQLERVDDTVTAHVEGAPDMVFVDLAPIEGPDADAVYIGRSTGTAAISTVRLERQRTALFVSALAPADSLRQEGRYARAISTYQTFLRDHPDSPLARDARFRIALCHEALHDDELALAAYLDVARLYRDHAHHAMAALFRAWGCSLRLGRHQEAESYFDAIRRSHELSSLLASVPEDTINALVADYAARAARYAVEEPMRALTLAMTGADLAEYLGLSAEFRSLRFTAADLLLGQFRPADALAALAVLPKNDAECQLRLGHAQRLLGDPTASLAAYASVVAIDPLAVTAQWARLWAGDLLLDREGEDAATTWWESSTDADSLPGRLMRQLLLGNRPLPLPEEDAAVVEYVNARHALRRGLRQQYQERLINCVGLAPRQVWPVPVAVVLSQAE